MIVKRIAPKNLTEKQFKNCKNLSLRSNGEMSHNLGKTRRYTWIESMCYLIEDKEKLLAWALVYYHKESDKTYAHFYVRLSERKKGFGKKLSKEVKKDYQKPTGAVHSKESRLFFSKVNYETVNLNEN